jgi:uncharacterized protein (TIGR02246 family)
MKSVSLFAAAIVAATAFSAPVAAKPRAMQCAVVSDAQVEGLFTKFNTAWATKDPAKVTALFTKDAVLLATVSNTPRTTPEAINDYFVKFLKGSPVGIIDTSTIKRGCNDIARVGTWTVKLTDPATGTVNDVKARYSFIYKMEGKEWKIDHLHSSMMPEKN